MSLKFRRLLKGFNGVGSKMLIFELGSIRTSWFRRPFAAYRFPSAPLRIAQESAVLSVTFFSTPGRAMGVGSRSVVSGIGIRL